jgi:hypothetical protein
MRLAEQPHQPAEQISAQPHEPAEQIAAAPRLRFAVVGTRALARAAVPSAVLDLRLTRTGGSAVRSATIAVRVDIAAARRSYDEKTAGRLVELFGHPSRWGQTLGTLGWARATVLVGSFEEQVTVELPLALSYDFDVAANKYLHALRDGEIPLDLSFGGCVLYVHDGRIQAAPIPWDSEATCRMPVQVWRDAIDSAFPNSAWLRVERDVFERLRQYRATYALTSWEQALTALLDRADQSDGDRSEEDRGEGKQDRREGARGRRDCGEETAWTA